MNVAATVVLLVVTMVGLGLVLRQRKLQDPAAVLRLLAVAFAAIAAVALFATVQRDSGPFAIWGLGLPVLVTLVPLFAARSRFCPVVTGMAAGFLLLWSVLLALGVGLALLPAALAETAAAVAQGRPRTPARNLTGTTSGG